MQLVQLLYSALLGLIQGISEWLPISSKTQILISSQYFLGITYSQAYTFGLFMEIGTILASIIYFRKDIAALAKVLLGSRDHEKRSLFTYVLVCTIVTGIIGVPLYIIADSITGVSVGIPMMVIGFVLVGDALVIRYSKRRQAKGINPRKFSDLKLRDYFVVGAVQGVSALPGVSRSGATTSALLVMNVEPDEAFRLSFLIGIFAAIAAFGLTLFVSRDNVSAAFSAIGTEGFIVAIIVATAVSLLLIDFLIRIASKSKIVYLTAALGAIAIGSGVVYFLLNL